MLQTHSLLFLKQIQFGWFKVYVCVFLKTWTNRNTVGAQPCFFHTTGLVTFLKESVSSTIQTHNSVHPSRASLTE